MLIPLSRTIRRDFRPPCNIVYRDIAPFTINIVKPRTANTSEFIVHFRQISCKIEHSIQEIRCITAQVLAILFRQLVSLMPNDIGLLSMFFLFLRSRLTPLRIKITLRLIASATARITFSRSPAPIRWIRTLILAGLMPTCTFVYLNHPIDLPSLLRCLQTLHFLLFLRAERRTHSLALFTGDQHLLTHRPPRLQTPKLSQQNALQKPAIPHP